VAGRGLRYWLLDDGGDKVWSSVQLICESQQLTQQLLHQLASMQQIKLFLLVDLVSSYSSYEKLLRD